MSTATHRMYQAVVAGFAIALVSPIAAQEHEIEFRFRTPDFHVWSLDAILHHPETDVAVVIAEIGLQFSGNNLGNVQYNPAFDSIFFGPADVLVTPESIAFEGANMPAPLNDPGGPDSSNALHIMSFTADFVDPGTFALTSNTWGGYEPNAIADQFYLTSDVFPQDINWYVTIPAPASSVLVLLAIPLCTRRIRRH